MTPTWKQTAFLSLANREALYGGATGGAKSYALLAAALQYVDVPGYSALLLRRTYGELKGEGGLLDIAMDWLSGTDATPHEGGKKWTFPSTAALTFGYLEHERHRYRYQGLRFQFVGFDELTQMPTDKGYRYLFSRIRQPQFVCQECGQPIERVEIPAEAWNAEFLDAYLAGQFDPGWTHDESEARPGIPTCDEAQPPELAAAPDGLTVADVPLRMRAATNPGGEGEGWVYPRFIEPWEKYQALRKEWYEARDAALAAGEPPPLPPSPPPRMFIPARLGDNPHLNRETYESMLAELDDVERAQLRDGLWRVKPSGGMFKRLHFEQNVIELGEVPEKAKWVRYWDLAGTEPTRENPDPDWTVGALVGWADGILYIRDIVRDRKEPTGVELLVQETAARDGKRLAIRMEQEPGSSGKNTISHYSRHVLPGYNFDGCPTVGDKVARASLWAPKVRRGEVKIVRGSWNDALFEEAADFSAQCAHDDQIDAISGAYEYLAGLRRGKASIIV